MGCSFDPSGRVVVVFLLEGNGRHGCAKISAVCDGPVQNPEYLGKPGFPGFRELYPGRA